MRAWLAIAAICVSSTVAADVSVDARGAGRFASCIAQVRALLRVRYPRDDDWDRGQACERKETPTKATLSCYGSCNDRSCHTDACTGHAEDLDIALVRDDGAPTAWTRDDAHRDWRVDWRRRYGAVRAEVTQYRSQYSRRVPYVIVRDVQETLDACLDVPY